MEIDGMESWPDAAVELCVNSASVTTYDRFVAALELWHRGRKRITELEAEVARKQVTIDSRGDLNRKQSERISEQDRLLGRTEESSAEQYERARKAEAENVKLREALQNCRLPVSAHSTECASTCSTRGCTCGVAEHNEYIEAALAKGDEKCY